MNYFELAHLGITLWLLIRCWSTERLVLSLIKLMRHQLDQERTLINELKEKLLNV